MKYILFLFKYLILAKVYAAEPRIDPLVQIPKGLIRGLRANDGDYSYFLGIPYAKVDLSDPFGPAQPHPGFEEVFDAYNGSIRCPQTNYEGTLDCLALNVYIPNEASSQNPLPVLVWVHGGGFSNGYGGAYHPRDLVNKRVIVVTINYRLGVYGFMCLNTPSVPGNQGLKDQYEALLWIKNNIAAFGGNPNEVTLAGQSAGSSSVLLHLYSDKEKLFNKVIAQSGTPLTEGMFVEADIEAAVKIANQLGYNTSDTEEAVTFLANASPNLVVDSTRDAGVLLRPCREKSFSGVDNFVASDPFSLSNEMKVSSTAVLIGHTNKEEIGLMNAQDDSYYSSDLFHEKIKTNYNVNNDELDQLAGIVRHFYIGDDAISREVMSNIEEFESDFKMYHPTRIVINNLLKENAKSVYEYLFSYTEDKNALGAGHSAELNHIFQMQSNIQSDESQIIRDRITSLWSNFVKYGNPTPDSSDDNLPVTWKPSTGDVRPYLVIDTDMRLEYRVFKERMSFWDLFHSIYSKNHKLSRECLI